MIVLDTHAWIWYVSNPEYLSQKAMEYVEQAKREKSIFISCISAWEVALLVKKGRLQLTMDVSDWISKVERLPFFQFVPVDNAIALKSVNLSGLHPDPADRIIIATALQLGAPIVTKDERIHAYHRVQTIW